MRANARALVAVVIILLTAPPLAAAQNGRSSTQQGSAPNGRPFRALQAQIDSLQQQITQMRADNASHNELISALAAAVLLLETRIETAEATIEELTAHDELLDQWIAELYDSWRDAEQRFDAQQDSIDALIEADRALQELIAALERRTDNQFGEVNTLLDELRQELATKQAAIIGACPSGSMIRQISSTGELTCESPTGGGAAGKLATSEWSDALKKVPPGSVGASTMVCPSGSVATGGGYHKSAAAPLFINAPSANGWLAAVLNTTSSEVSVRAFVRCAAVVP